MAGKFIVFEGIDGCGKHTQIEKLREFLSAQQQEYHIVQYPDIHKPIGQLLDQFLQKEFELRPDVQFMLYMTDMVKDKDTIRSLLDKGVTVIANRYITSTLAYQCSQGFAFEKGKELINTMNLLSPDLIVYLDLAPDLGLKRKMQQKGSLDRFETEIEFLEKVHDLYAQLQEESFLAQWKLVDANRKPEEIFEDIKKLLHL